MYPHYLLFISPNFQYGMTQNLFFCVFDDEGRFASFLSYPGILELLSNSYHFYFVISIQEYSLKNCTKSRFSSAQKNKGKLKACIYFPTLNFTACKKHSYCQRPRTGMYH